MNKTVSIIIIIGLVIAAFIVFSGGSKESEVSQPGSNIEIKDGVQYITISAKGGYSPRESNAQAGIPTKLIVETNGTYDCSAALVLKSVGFQKMLPQTGKTEIDIGIPKAGELFRGVCGMGMYSFVIKFN